MQNYFEILLPCFVLRKLKQITHRLHAQNLNTIVMDIKSWGYFLGLRIYFQPIFIQKHLIDDGTPLEPQKNNLSI